MTGNVERYEFEGRELREIEIKGFSKVILKYLNERITKTFKNVIYSFIAIYVKTDTGYSIVGTTNRLRVSGFADKVEIEVRPEGKYKGIVVNVYITP